MSEKAHNRANHAFLPVVAQLAAPVLEEIAL
jgi:hypothetical protein